VSEELEQVGDLAWALEGEAKIWAIRPELLAGLLALRRQNASLEAMREKALEFYGADLDAIKTRAQEPAQAGAVALIPLKGVITPNVSLLALLFGMGSGLAAFRESLKEAKNSDEVDHIVLDIDSPGGVTDLIPEVADEVAAAAKVKPVTAVANTMAASAAYWIASQAQEIVVTPSGEVGSIGVFAEHWDFSRALEQVGEKPTLISAGKYKTEANPFEPLSEEAQEAIQGTVDYYYDMFTESVAQGRGVSVSSVKSGYGEGRVRPARKAVEEGLADRVGTLQSVISEVTSSGGTPARALRIEEDFVPIKAEEEEPPSQEEPGKVVYTSEELDRIASTLIG